MKNLLTKLLSTSILLPIGVTPIVYVTSCNDGQLVTSTESYWNQDQVNTVHSLKTMNGNKQLLYLDYTADYKLDSYIKKSPTFYTRSDVFNEVLLNGQSKYKLPNPKNSKACTAVAVNGSDGKKYLARSMDWNYDGTFNMILKTHAHPESGSKYDTLGMVHTTYFYGIFDEVNKPDHAEALLFAPYSDITDGFNSAGLAIAQLDLEYGTVKQQEQQGLPNVPFSLLSRLVLDKCDTVENAIKFIKNQTQDKYTYYSDHFKSDKPGEGTTSHWLLEDASGSKASIVFEGSDGFNKPNIAITYQPTKVKSFDGYHADEGSFDCTLEYAENNVPTKTDNLWITNFYLNNFNDGEGQAKAKALNLIESEGYYRAYCIQKFLEHHKNPTFNEIKSILKMVRYSIDIDIVVRYLNQGLDPMDPEVWEKWMTTYSVIYNLTDQNMTIWNLEDFDHDYHISLK